MMLVAIFFLNAALSFALSLALASLLGPEGFGRFAIGLSVTLVVNTALFEWLRLSTTRFYGERARGADPGVRVTLDRAYHGMAAGLVVATGALIGLGLHGGFPAGLLAAAAFCGLAYGFCEYRMALARARFLNGPYAALGLLRGVLGFGLAAGAAWLWRDPALVLVGAALAAALPILVVHRILADPAAGARFDRALLGRFARYALPLVAASALYQLLPLLNRTALASREGLAEAGYFALASELATRLFQNLGAALDLVLFQLAVRAEEEHGRDAASAQIARNVAIVAAIVLPAAGGLWAVWPAFEALFIPTAFQGRLDSTITLVVPALAAFALVQYALNPIFQLRHRTQPVIAAASVALVVDGAGLLLWPGLSGSSGFAALQLAAFGAGLVVLGGVAVRAGARLPWRDLGLACAASGLMTLVLWPLRGASGAIPTLLVQVTLGIAVYGALALAFDIAGSRTVAARLGPALLRRARPSTSR